MTAQSERQLFSERLQDALASANLNPSSPTKLAKNFNAFAGADITVHAARKWLMGEAIPTQDKLRLLAEMLNVSVEYLRFGTGGTRLQAAQKDMSASHLILLGQINSLTKQNQLLVSDFVTLLLKRQV